MGRLTPEQIEELAVEIRTFLLNHDMWVDTVIYFNGKCFSTYDYDRETGKFYYNDPEHLVVRDNEDPRDYFEHVADDHMLYYGSDMAIKRQFDKIFEKRGIYYELGDHWNLTCYYG